MVSLWRSADEQQEEEADKCAPNANDGDKVNTLTFAPKSAFRSTIEIEQKLGQIGDCVFTDAPHS